MYYDYPCMRRQDQNNYNETHYQSMPFPMMNQPEQNVANMPAGMAPQQYINFPTPMMYPLEPIGTTLPTGMPVPQSVMPPAAIPAQYQSMEPETMQDPAYIPGFLKRHIGEKVRVEYLIGSTGPLVDRIGTLLGVGANYILLRPEESDDLLMSDLYSIKFVTIMK